MSIPLRPRLQFLDRLSWDTTAYLKFPKARHGVCAPDEVQRRGEDVAVRSTELFILPVPPWSDWLFRSHG